MAIRLSTIGETLPPVERKDGFLAPTIEPMCQEPECEGALRDTGKTQGTASAGTLSLLQCTVCRKHTYWRARPAFELVSQEIQF